MSTTLSSAPMRAKTHSHYQNGHHRGNTDIGINNVKYVELQSKLDFKMSKKLLKKNATEMYKVVEKLKEYCNTMKKKYSPELYLAITKSDDVKDNALRKAILDQDFLFNQLSSVASQTQLIAQDALDINEVDVLNRDSAYIHDNVQILLLLVDEMRTMCQKDLDSTFSSKRLSSSLFKISKTLRNINRRISIESFSNKEIMSKWHKFQKSNEVIE